MLKLISAEAPIPPGAIHPDSLPAAGSAAPLAGRHAVVTGGSRGIGAAIALELARLGADLTVLARGRAALDALAPRLAAAGAREVHALTCDAADAEALARVLEAAARALGPVAVLVNNAGGAESAAFARTDLELWRRTFALNVDSAFAATRAVLPGMLAAGWGRVVNVASTAGLKGYAYVAAYVAAKHALVGLTRALALETAKSGVTVNAVCPGFTDTPMVDAAVRDVARRSGRDEAEAREALAAFNPMGRLVRPEEVAAAVGWLCTRAAGAVNGAAIPVAGGEV
jgi:NAD(P)-dependent dehydrogenase (short-subunit alcohol dehydrogenase family)